MKCELKYCPEAAMYELHLGPGDDEPKMLCREHFISFKTFYEGRNPGGKVQVTERHGARLH